MTHPSDFDFLRNDAGTLWLASQPATGGGTCAAEVGFDDPAFVVGTPTDLAVYEYQESAGLLIRPSAGLRPTRRLQSVGRYQYDAGYFVSLLDDGGIQMIRTLGGSVAPVSLTAPAAVTDFVGGSFEGDPPGGFSLFVVSGANVERWAMTFPNVVQVTITTSSPPLPGAPVRFAHGQLNADGKPDLVVAHSGPDQLVLLLSR